MYRLAITYLKHLLGATWAMIKTNLTITIEDLVHMFPSIDFPEYQREPSVWDLWKKRRLIDSVLRDFDISSIYLYKYLTKKKDKMYDCIDGRQRINAILSYLGKNPEEGQDNEFRLKISNEISQDTQEYKDVDNKMFSELNSSRKKQILGYRLNVVVIEKVENEEELNLLFLRLQLGSILNAGEKLHAMIGDMRNAIFGDGGLGKHKFFQEIKIPYRRYAREQVAAQLVLNYFSLRKDKEYHRARYIDLQDFFKNYSTFSTTDQELILRIRKNLDKITKHFGKKLALIKNRAIAVSVFLFVSMLLEDKQEAKIGRFIEFFEKFIDTLKWQVARGMDFDREYRELLKFQSYVTQAAGERYAIENRQKFWEEYFAYYEKERRIKGDKEYRNRTKKDPDEERSKE